MGEPKYIFFKKIKPDTYLWCTSMQTRVKFEDEVWIGVVSEHYVCGYEKHGRVFYGNIFTNSEAFWLYVTNYNIEFEVWEDSSTEGEIVKKNKKMCLHVVDNLCIWIYHLALTSQLSKRKNLIMK